MIKTIKNILNSQFYAISLYARSIAGTLILFVIARYLSVYDYGLFSSYKTIAVFCLMFANLGFSDYILVSSKANQREVKLKMSMFIINAIFITALICFGGILYNLESKLLFSLVVVRTFLDGTFFLLILPYFQSAKKFNVIATVNSIYALCILLIAVISYIFKLSLVKFLTLNIILGIINFIQCSFYAKLDYFLFFNNLKRFFKLIDKSIFAFMCTSIAYYLYAQTTSFYVATYISKEKAALYFAAYTIASIVTLLIGAQTQKMVPEMIKASAEKIKIVIRKNLIFIISITFAVFVFMIFFGKLILNLLYGQEYYTNGYFILLILMLGNIAVAEAAVYGTYITASGNQKMKIPMQLEATVITVLGLALFYKYEIYAAAFTYLISTVYIAARYTITTNNLLNRHQLNS